MRNRLTFSPLLSVESRQPLDGLLEELEWRFNERDNLHIFRDTLKRIARTPHLTYRRLLKKWPSVPSQIRLGILVIGL